MDMKCLYSVLAIATLMSFASAKDLEANDLGPVTETSQGTLEAEKFEIEESDEQNYVDSDTNDKSREKRAFTPETQACIEGCDFINFARRCRGRYGPMFTICKNQLQTQCTSRCIAYQ